MFSHDIFVFLHVKTVHDVIRVDFQAICRYQKHNKLSSNMILQTKMPNNSTKFKLSTFLIQYYTQILVMHHCKNASVHLKNHALSIKHFANVLRLTNKIRYLSFTLSSSRLRYLFVILLCSSNTNSHPKMYARVQAVRSRATI